MKEKTSNNKVPNGIISFVTIILLLSFILALTLAYESAITANVVKELSTDTKIIPISIKEVDNINELSQLNEGWYEIRNGYIFYLDTFNSYVPLYIKVKNPEQQNGLLVVDEDGNFGFKRKVKKGEWVLRWKLKEK